MPDRPASRLGQSASRLCLSETAIEAPRSESDWHFSIDVGGTFTDVVARTPDGRIVSRKLLSSGAIRGVIGAGSTATCIVDARRIGDPVDFWVGADLQAGYQQAGLASACATLIEAEGASRARVVRFDSATGQLHLDRALEPHRVGDAYELRGDEGAPVTAIRLLMQLSPPTSVGPINVRLGTTRATNALLERKGASVAFVTTKGFADVLKIGNQDRPKLFELDIHKRDELTTMVVEIDERLTATGEVLRAPDEREVRGQLEAVRSAGIETLAVCLLHAYVNPEHEERIARIAEPMGFAHVSVSSRVARMQKIVPRGDTTVVDAYLTPVIRDYVSAIRRSLPEARLHLMTSNGGLVDASSVVGKDTILSGPAGGVVGCAQISRVAGFDRVIGFDMGGTSTDVSRIEPPPNEFEYKHETVQAGVRLMTPMLAVETVAAGGGSVCAFDGQMLTVGPHSAGADPGPACYGRGGPLAVTDMNVFLGRIPDACFPFPLDRTVVERGLGALCERINRESGSRHTPISLAEGFIRIANEKMAAAIKRISLAKGYDVREYVLTAFGGAGGQHACALARAIGIKRVLCSPLAGVLSAVGIGVAGIKRLGERSVCVALDGAAGDALEAVFVEMTERLERELAGEGIDANQLLDPIRTADLCYEGQATFITVPAGVGEPACRFNRLHEEFETKHRRLYGYTHDGRGVEVRAVRVELGARSNTSPATTCREGILGTADQGAVARTIKMVVAARRRCVPLYLRSELVAGQQIAGPAVIAEETSTIVIESGWHADVQSSGDVVLTDQQAASIREEVSTKADPVQLELFNNQFASVAQQMGATLRRTSLSTNVKERLDYSCALFTPEGDLVVNAPHIPVHLGGMSDCVKALIEDVGSFSPGDVLITNDPYRGGSHLNDVTVITPVHDDVGTRILFFVANRAHHAEIGGSRPGSMPPDSTCLAEEGVLIRAMHWIENGKPQHDRLRTLLTESPFPSRTPAENLADIAAQVAANQTGVRELSGMIARYGVEVVHGYMRHIQTAAQRKMRDALRDMPDGEYTFEDGMDDGTMIRLRIMIDGETARFDFSGTSPVHAGNLNANRAIVTSAVLYCLRCLIDDDIPLNAGVLAPIEIILPECFLNPPASLDPQKCPAVVGGNVETSQRIVDCIFGALGTVAAGQGTMNNLLMGNERFGYYETICGGAGAGDGFDGADAVHTHMTNTRMTDPEVLESRVPVRLVRFEIRTGSGGAGRWRGGCGVVREFEFLEPLDISILSQRRTTRPYGLQGGQSGQSGINTLTRRGSAETRTLGGIAQLSVSEGDRITIETPGGGGFGKRQNVETSKQDVETKKRPEG